MRYSNGDIYEGMFEYDLCSKVGKMTYKDGSVYDGSWSNGLVSSVDHAAATPCMLKVVFGLLKANKAAELKRT